MNKNDTKYLSQMYEKNYRKKMWSLLKELQTSASEAAKHFFKGDNKHCAELRSIVLNRRAIHSGLPIKSTCKLDHYERIIKTSLV